MSNFVPGRGPKDARIVVVGEAPGRQENRLLRPFVGVSGHLLERWMRDAGIDPSAVYYDNVYPFYPPNTNIHAVPKDELQRWSDDLIESRLLSLERPHVIVPVGNVALKALIGESGIMKWRGSIIPNGLLSSFQHPVKIIPTIHPAAVLRSGGGAEREETDGFKIQIPWEKRCRQDWQRISQEAASPEASLPQRDHWVDPTKESEPVQRLLELADSENEVMSIDIETPSRKDIACVGFCIDPSWSVTIPFKKRWQKRLIKHLCASNCDKVMHNGYGFDQYWLWQEHIEVTHFYWDTLAMHHTLDPAEEHSLQFLTSIYTREPYYKDEGKFEALDGVLRRDFQRLMTYCGKDVCVTREIFDVLYEMLEKE